MNTDNIKKPILVQTHWKYLAMLEGIVGTAQLWILKIVGSVLAIFPVVFLLGLIVGSVQVVGGALANRRSKYAYLPGMKYVAGSLLVGVINVYIIAVYVYIFYVANVDIAFIAFLVSLFVIPKFLVDRLVFREGISLRHLIGIPLFIFALYAFLDFPSFNGASYPLWFWLSLTLPIATFLHGYIEKPFKLGVISVWIKNFWSGVSTVILSLIFIGTINPPVSPVIVDGISARTWFLFFVLGVSALISTFLRQRTYMRGGSVVQKQMVLVSSCLISAIAVGVIVFKEPFGPGLAIGLLSILVGYFLFEGFNFRQATRLGSTSGSSRVLSDGDGEFDFKDLVIFEMSKNHGGDVGYALRIVREFAQVANDTGVKAAVKLQFRNLDSYIHPDYRGGGDERMQRYFTSHLKDWEFLSVVDEIKEQGLISMSTPFDEESVDTIDRLGVEVIKVASSSAKDWPLLERIVESKKPIVCSTGRLEIEEIDKLVAFFKKHDANFALLHCVGLYPTPDENKELNRLTVMKERYPNVTIGFSTHEDPNDFDIVKMAYAKGARLFEKHVTILNERFSNDSSFKKVLGYTATPNQMRKWIESYQKAVTVCGTDKSESYSPSESEKKSVESMVRGMYFKNPVKRGYIIRREDVFFAIPYTDGNLHAGDWRRNMVANKNYSVNEPVPKSLK